MMTTDRENKKVLRHDVLPDSRFLLQASLEIEPYLSCLRKYFLESLSIFKQTSILHELE